MCAGLLWTCAVLNMAQCNDVPVPADFLPDDKALDHPINDEQVQCNCIT